VLEIKSMEKVLPVHEAQLLTYLRMGGWTVGLIVNFNVRILLDAAPHQQPPRQSLNATVDELCEFCGRNARRHARRLCGRGAEG
jgi:hypothetical protein